MKALGMRVGFPEKTADVRMAQYESGTRNPKEELTKELAQALDVSPFALSVPDIDTSIGLMHTLFTLEDLYGLTAEIRDSEVVFRIDPREGLDAAAFYRMAMAWAEEADKLRSGEITEEEYDRWRYYYPQYDTSGQWANIPTKEFSDAIATADLKKHPELLD